MIIIIKARILANDTIMRGKFSAKLALDRKLVIIYETNLLKIKIKFFNRVFNFSNIPRYSQTKRMNYINDLGIILIFYFAILHLLLSYLPYLIIIFMF